jgi:hypothetical protein
MTEPIRIGSCELYCGDCMDYMAGLPDKAFDSTSLTLHKRYIIPKIIISKPAYYFFLS